MACMKCGRGAGPRPRRLLFQGLQHSKLPSSPHSLAFHCLLQLAAAVPDFPDLAMDYEAMDYDVSTPGGEAGGAV